MASNLATSLATAGPGMLLREESLQERPPLYPLLLTGLFTAFGASPDVGRIGQALLHGLVPLLTYAGVRCFAGPGWAVLGALLAAWQPHVFTAVSVLSYEHLQALTWLAATVWLWYTFQREQLWHYAVAALLWATSALVKPYTLAGPLLLLAGVAVVTTLRTTGGHLVQRRGQLPTLRARRSPRGPLLFVAVFLLALVPWLVRSRLVYGEVVPVTPGVGLGVWAATLEQLPNDWTNDPRIRAVQARALQTGRGANVAQMDRVFLEEGLARIAADPWRALRTLLGRQLHDWLGVPHDMYTLYGSGPDDPPARWSLGLLWPQVQAVWAETGLLPRLSLLPLLDWASTQARRQHLALLALAVAGLGIALVRRDRAAVLAQLTPWCIFLTVWPTVAHNRYAVPFYPLFVLSAVYALASCPLLLPVRPAGERIAGRGLFARTEPKGLRTEPPRPLGRVILLTGRALLSPQSAVRSPEQSPQSSALRRGAQAALLWLGTVLVLRSLAQTVALAFLQRGLPGP
jgi:signal transduction histidine kinase